MLLNKPAGKIILPGNLFLLAGLFLLLLSHLSHLPIWLSAVCLALIVWKLLHEYQWLTLPGKYLRFAMLASVLAGILYSYHTLLGREAGSAMLLALLCLKLFEVKTLRDASILVQLALFAIVITFLFSQTILMAIQMLVIVVLLLSAVISYSHATTNTAPGSAWLYLRRAASLLVHAVPLGLLLFIVFPRITAPLWNLPADAFQGQTGLSEQMSPGRISQLLESNAVAFRVRFKDRLPDKNSLYWRGPVLWNFDGYTWSAPLKERQYSHAAQLQNATQLTAYTITIEPHNKNWLIALDMPAMLPLTTKMSSENQLLTHDPLRKLQRFELVSALNYKLGFNHFRDRELYLRVPEKSAPQARKFIAQLTSRNSEPQQVLNAVLKHFQQNPFYYSRNPPLLFDDPIDEFLFQTRRGYCEHFASTFTVLMRLAGIPARIVTGYQGGHVNPLDDYLIVRQSDAHAWSEVFLEDQGWVRVDPTSVIPANRIENANDVLRLRTPSLSYDLFATDSWLSNTARQFKFAWDAINNRWNQWVIGYNQKQQQAFFKAFGIESLNWQLLIQVLFLGFALFSLVLALLVFRRKHRNSDRLNKLYARYLKKLKPYHVSKLNNEGVLDFALRTAAHFPDREQQIVSIANQYNKIRYGTSNAGDFLQLRNQIKQLKFN